MGRKTEHSERADWHPEDIKAAIRKTGISLRRLAIEHGYEESVVRKALKRPAAQVQSIIAAHLGVPPQTIWPSRYDDRGEYLDRRRVGLRRDNCRRGGGDSQKQEVA
jgi:Ner family transcriptional regulator